MNSRILTYVSFALYGATFLWVMKVLLTHA